MSLALYNFHTFALSFEKMNMKKEFDFLIIGSGIAGLSYALKVAAYGKVGLVSKTVLDETNTAYAQGGISSVTYEPDSFKKHVHDTLIAGDGLCNVQAVDKVVSNAPEQINQLLNWGINFDKNKDGKFDLHREQQLIYSSPIHYLLVYQKCCCSAMTDLVWHNWFDSILYFDVQPRLSAMASTVCPW